MFYQLLGITYVDKPRNEANIEIISGAGYQAVFDATEEILRTSWLQLCLTSTLVLVIVVASYIASRETNTLLYEPLNTIMNVVRATGSDLFPRPEQQARDSEAGLIDEKVQKNAGVDIITIQRTLGRIMRMFKVSDETASCQRKTTVHTPASVVWSVDVKRQVEQQEDAGHGTSHRLYLEALELMRKPGPRQRQIQNFIFSDFVRDPVATRYFADFLRTQDDTFAEGLLDFTEEMKAFESDTQDIQDAAASLVSETIDAFERFQHKEFTPVERKQIIDSTRRPREAGEPSFGLLIDAANDYLRSNCLGAFLDSEQCEQLLMAKHSGKQKGILVERDYQWDTVGGTRVTRRSSGKFDPKTPVKHT